MASFVVCGNWRDDELLSNRVYAVFSIHTIGSLWFSPLVCVDTPLAILRRIYTTFILGKPLLNFGTRANNMGHGPLEFCRVKANFSARVPKNLGRPRPTQEVVSARLRRRPRAQIGGIFVPRVFPLIIDHAGEGSGVVNKLLYREPRSCNYAEKKTWRREICFWSNDVNRPVVGGNCSVRVRKKQNLKGNERSV